MARVIAAGIVRLLYETNSPRLNRLEMATKSRSPAVIATSNMP